jgi:hypothetical protein
MDHRRRVVVVFGERVKVLGEVAELFHIGREEILAAAQANLVSTDGAIILAGVH